MKELKYPKKFKTEDDLKKWLNENNIEYIGVHIFDNDDWSYYDEQGFWHLYRDGVELTKGVKAIYAFSFNNGDWGYKDEHGDWHKFDKNGNEIL